MSQSTTHDDGTARRRRASSGGTDVARLAGVSQKTVSRVFTNEPHVSESVRERVLAAARELGYRPNSAARALNTGRTHRLGVVSLGSALYGPTSQLLAIEMEARALGYTVSLVNTAEGDVEGVAGAVEALLGQGVDGIVLSEPIYQGPIELDVEVPVLSCGTFPGLSAPVVVVAGGDEVAAGRSTTEYLLSLGHLSVHHIAGPQRWYAARERHDGWAQALTVAGIAHPRPVEGDWSAESGYTSALELLRDPDVTAVFAANDDMAVGAIRAFTEVGLKVPGDISVAGFDDIPLAPYLNPPLTTVAAQHGDHARRGLDALVKAIEGRSTGPRETQNESYELVIRGSTGISTGRTPRATSHSTRTKPAPAIVGRGDDVANHPTS